MKSRGEGGAEQPFLLPLEPQTSLAAAPTADAPCAGLAALSLLSPGPGDSSVAGGGAMRPAPSFRSGAGCAASPPGASASATRDGAVARGGGAPRLGLAAAAAPPTPAGGASVPGDGPPAPVGDDGASLSAEASANPFSPPASEGIAAFLKLMDHTLKAALLMRHVRQADFSALAVEAGVPLFGDDSSIVAKLRASQASALNNQAAVEADPPEAVALQRRAWSVLLTQALPVLQSRIDKDTLLPGKLRKVEEAYYVYEQQMLFRLTEDPVPVAVALQEPSRLMGYETALHVATTALIFLPLHPWRSDERGRAQAFVLSALRLIRKAAAWLPCNEHFEIRLADIIERHMTPDNYGADFCASVLDVWLSPAVANVLRSRGVLQGATANAAAVKAEFDARQKADLAKRGLRRCALPSCGKQEANVLQFRVCGHCQTTRYCCPEHAKQHWKAHKREYEAEEEERGEAGDVGGGA